MTEPRELVRDEMLDKALDVFWEKGYEGTTVEDLCAATGIGQSSLYGLFGSKEGVFAEALDRYEAMMAERVLAPLAADAPVKDVIRQIFDAQAAALCAAESRCCLAVKAAVGAKRGDEALRARVGRFVERVDAAFLDALERGQRNGEIPEGRNLPALSRYLTHSLQGLFVSAAMRRDPDALRDLARTSLIVLDA